MDGHPNPEDSAAPQDEVAATDFPPPPPPPSRHRARWTVTTLIAVGVAVIAVLSLIGFLPSGTSTLSAGGPGNCTAEQEALLDELGLPEGAMPEAPTHKPGAFGPGDFCDQRVGMPPDSTTDVIDFFRPRFAEGGWRIAYGPQIHRMFAPGEPVIDMLAERGSDTALIEVYTEGDTVRLFWVTIKKGTTPAADLSSGPSTPIAPATASRPADTSGSLDEYFMQVERSGQVHHAKLDEAEAAAQNQKGEWLTSGDYRVLVAAMTDSITGMVVRVDAMAADLEALNPPKKVRAAHDEYLSALRALSRDVESAAQDATAAKEEYIGGYPFSTRIIDFWTAYYWAMAEVDEDLRGCLDACNALQEVADENEIDRDVGC